MAFPDAERVFYQKNPLAEVICQIRFPSILKIDTESPTEFQEEIRRRFPYYKMKATLKFPDELAKLVVKEVPLPPGGTAHEFTSKDKNWSLSLTRGFLAIVCREYSQWEDFKDWLQEPLEIFLQLYKPAFFTRIGLRYRNIIDRSVLELEDVRWSELLEPWIAGPLAAKDVAERVDHCANEILIHLPDERSRVHVHHGLVKEESTNKVRYLLDADLFDDQETEADDAVKHLDYFNEQARLLFRWCITERLHRAMVPQPLSRD